MTPRLPTSVTHGTRRVLPSDGLARPSRRDPHPRRGEGSPGAGGGVPGSGESPGDPIRRDRALRWAGGGAMHYGYIAITEEEVPRAGDPLFQHLVTTYAGETNKTAGVWRAVPDVLLDYRPHEK